jgi:two-component system cell cycle response regulator
MADDDVKIGRVEAHGVTMVGVASRETLTAVGAPESSDPDALLLIVMSGNNVGHIHQLDPNKMLTVIGREETAEVQVLDAEISRRHAAIRYEAASGRWLIDDLDSRNGTAVNGEPVTDAEVALQPSDKIRLGSATVLRLTKANEPEARYARKMYQVALRDGLTGAYNRRYLEERLASEMAFAKRHDSPLALLMLDIDHFKRINDDFGHQAGDAVLKQFCEILQEGVRTEDVVARYGGEEFSVLCRDSLETDALILAERLREAVESAEFAWNGKRIPVTVSIGVAGTQENAIADATALVAAGDAALYEAKDNGRNRVVLAGS